jgi:two-component system, OmpR family, response regulator RegX3
MHPVTEPNASRMDKFNTEDNRNLNVYDDGSLHIEHDSYYVTIDGQILSLPPKEFLLLSGLSRNIGRMAPSDVLWRHAWKGKKAFNSKTLRVHICNLRSKIEPLGLNIRSIAALGYCLFWVRQQIQTKR